MITLPAELLPWIIAFQPLFSKSVWNLAQTLMVGAILTPNIRTVTACLRAMGLSFFPHFQNYHRVLNRAQWSPLKASRILLRLLINAFAPKGPLVFGIDDTIERRWGQKIRARGIYRDPVRSSHSHLVKVSGLRWLSCMLLTHIPWAKAIWALPFLTILSPSEHYDQKRGRTHQKLAQRAWILIRLLSRWLPKRCLIFVTDSSFAVLELLGRCSKRPNVSLISRLRLDAQLWDFLVPLQKREKGRPRVKGKRRQSPKQRLQNPKTVWREIEVENWYGEKKRKVEVYSEKALWYTSGFDPVGIHWVLIRDPLGKFESQALLSTNLEHTVEEILSWFVRRWRMEVTFEESRRYMGIETQRQWNDLAIVRTTPVLFGLFSMVTLMAGSLMKKEKKSVLETAWYKKKSPTFSDALSVVRRNLWQNWNFSTSPSEAEMIKIPRPLLNHLKALLCYSA